MPVNTLPGEPQSAEYAWLKQALPGWLATASDATREALRGASTVHVDWLASLTPAQRSQLQQDTDRSVQSQHALEQAMAALPSIERFAQPLLSQALKAQFNLDVDVQATFVHLRKPFELGAFGIQVGSFSVLSLSLLQAALHNFEEAECRADAFDTSSQLRSGAKPSDPPLVTGMTVRDFLGLCRTLDIGAQYQAELTRFFQATPGLRDLQVKARKDALQAAARLALLKHDIEAGDYTWLQAVLADQRKIQADGTPVWFCDLSIMGLRLSGITVFVPVKQYHYAGPVVAYIPHDPQHPLKRYASAQALEAELTRQLTAEADAASPSAYQRFFANFLAYADQPVYFSRLTEDAAGGARDPAAALRSPLADFALPLAMPVLSIWLKPRELPPKPSVRREPIKDANFYIRVISKRGLWADNVDLWRDDFDKMHDKLLADARSHAVPTADVDAKARTRKIAALLQGGLAALNLVSMFVPVLGEVMLGVMASQLLYQSFDGVIEWSEGDREAALGHISDVAQNLALLALMAGGGAGVRLAFKAPALEPFKAVTLPSGARTLWKTDLAPYATATRPALAAKADSLGLYLQGNEPLLPLEGEHYRLKRDGDELRIRHPSRAHAYAPRVEHNHEGAWQHEAEHPLSWDGRTVLKRLGQPVEGLGIERLQQACLASGVDPDALRAGHLDQEPAPLLLTDTLHRLRLHAQLATYIEQIRSPDPAVYALADPSLKVELLKRRGALPDDPAEQRQALGNEVEGLHGVLVEERYRAQTRSDSADVARVTDRYPQLPTAIAEHLLKTLEPEQLQALRDAEGLPEAQAQQAQWCEQEVRVARAYEGLFLDALEGLDSQRLALHTLETLPGWPRDTRFEWRAFSATGDVLDAIGAADAPTLKRVVLDDGGGPSHDLYAALWDQLSPPQRTALGVGDAAQLKARVRQAPLPREALRTLLLEHPLRKPAYAPSMRLLGGGRGLRRLTNALRTPAGRAQRLYPAFNEAAVEAFLQSLGDDVHGGLERLEEQYATLKRTLKTWVRSHAPQAAVTAFDCQGGLVKTYADEILRCWRRETSRLRIHASEPLRLPALSADFSHVEALDLANLHWTPEADTFLANFQHVSELQIRKAGLTQLPASVGEMSRLIHLQLRNNQIRLTAHAVRQLGRLTQLETLDLHGNALDLAPDFSGMPHLKTIDLSHNAIEQWPLGLREQTQLQRLDLSGNQLRSVPAAHLTPAAEHLARMVAINGVTVVHDNPFSIKTALEVNDYWRRLTAEHPEWLATPITDAFSIETPLMAKVRQLHPEFAHRRAREYIWSLGEGGETLLNQRFQEFTTLNEQLNAWSFSGGGARQGYVRVVQVLENAQTREDRFIAKDRILKCWRRETPQVQAHDGTPIGLQLDLSGLSLPTLPDLDADFSHVGSVKLNNMHLTTSPEGFLARHRGLRWLDMSDNQLRELPPAIGQMHGLTRLFLRNNQLRLTAASAQMLSERVTLRALWLDDNPLGIAPDFSQISDMRSLSLARTGLDSWPEGLADQPRLDTINLAGNRLSSLPEFLVAPSEAQWPNALRLSAVVDVRGNPLSEATLQQVRAFGTRLELADPTQAATANRLVSSALAWHEGLAQPLLSGGSFRRWTQGFSPEQMAHREAQWLELRKQAGGNGFFTMLADLDTTHSARDGLQQRVWQVIDSITERSEASELLRQQMFEWAGRPACCDRAALSFANVEVMAMVARARAMAGEAEQGVALMKLSRGLFRLDEVEKTALADIAERTRAINARTDLDTAQKRQQVARLEEVEIRLAYREGLKGSQQLDLPGAPLPVRFTDLAQVSAQTLEATRLKILALDNSPEEVQALLSRDFWQDYLTHQYRPRFDALSKPYQQQLAELHDQLQAHQISPSRYEARARDLQAQLAIEEASLMQTLTEAEREAHPLG